VKFLVIVNESPWGSTLSLSACRFVNAALDCGVAISAVYFREEGIYNSLPGEAPDAGTPDLCSAWRDLARTAGFPLLVCSSSRLRRLAEPPANGFQSSGLTEMFELVLDSDRVVTF